MRFIGKFTKAESEKSGENFFVQCLSPIPFTLQEQLKMNHMYLKVYVAIKRMKSLFGIKEKKTRKAIDYVSSLL